MSLCTGAKILFKLCCPQCGEPLSRWQTDVSDFFQIQCENKECSSYMQEALVERRTGQVLSVNHHEFRDAYGKRWRVKYEEVEEKEDEKQIL